MTAETTCPFCKGHVSFNAESAMAAHTIPTCKTFKDSKDALDFLEKVNMAMRVYAS